MAQRGSYGGRGPGNRLTDPAIEMFLFANYKVVANEEEAAMIVTRSVAHNQDAFG
jgi:hypothetical protein